MTDTQQKLLEQLYESYKGDAKAIIKDLASLARKPKAAAKSKRANGPLLVDLKSVTKTYKLGKQTVHAVDDVSLQIYEGEIVALIGPSGSGKSTIMNMIGGLDQPTTGDVMFNGVSIPKLSDAKLSVYRNKNIGFVFQFFYLQPFLKLKKNVQLPAIFSRLPKSEREARSAQYIESVGLTERAGHLPNELSGGQMQRAAIARALVNHPKLILADEPTGNLDSTNGQSVMEQFIKTRDEQGTTIIIVTHDSKIAHLADRVIELKDGKVVN
jgi:ABC-type lipoprotein export system ATPase subunit